MPSVRPSRSARASTSSAAGTIGESSNATIQDAPTKTGKAHSSHEGHAPIAIDLGAYSVRIALGSSTTSGTTSSTESQITVKCPNAIVRQVQQRRFATNSSTSAWLVGPQIQSQCANFGSLSVRQPMDRGLVVDWLGQKAVLDAALSVALAKEEQERTKSKSVAANGKSSKQRLLEGRTAIITEAYLNLPDLQSAMDMLLIEEYGAASIWRCAPAYLLPYTPNLFVSSSHEAGPGRKRTRPECMIIVDLGHGASHIVPVVGDEIVWQAVRRHVVSQRLLTNLFKESLSFRQWDMMDEAWLVGHIKQTSCFVAAHAGRRGESVDVNKQSTPSQWSFAALVELCQNTPKGRNPIVQEYVLPDYSAGSSKASKYGHIKRGPGKGIADLRSLDDDSYIAVVAASSDGRKEKDNEESTREESEDEEDDDSSDDDFDGAARAGASGSDEDEEDDVEKAPKPRKKQKTEKESKSIPQSQKRQTQKPNKDDDDEDEMEQVLVLERERFQVPEVMFNPAMAGLDGAPLHEVIRASIEACNEEHQGLMWANVVLVGGGAQMRGIRQRLENELRALAPSDVPLNVWTRPLSANDADLAAIKGAQNIMNAPQGSVMGKMLKARLLPASEYNLPASRERFGSWSKM